ncbi:MAG: dTDP-4-dehydrorhamnose reductase [Ilumatobacteraceae bacterium]
MKILVTGAAGQLGREIVDVAQVRGLDVVAADRTLLDITDDDAVRRVVALHRPDAIMHAAAWTAVDACEADPDKANRVNGTATAVIVAAAREVGASVHVISTDYVFDGTKSRPYVETDATNPQSAYGRSKLLAERSTDPQRDTVIRVSWLSGFHGANMVKTILRLAATPGPLRFVSDQVGHPTFADDAAGMIVRLVTERRTGIWHVTNQRAVSWYQFACEVLAAAGEDPARVEPVLTSELVPPRPAPRPANSVLDNARLRAEGIELLDDFRVPLARLVARLRAATL